jgi:hypothetical protein
MIDHNTRRVLLSFLIIVFLTFEPCFRQVTSDSSEGATVTIVLAIIFYYYKEYYSCRLFLPCFSCSGQITCDNPEGAIMIVVGGNILDETWSRLSKLYT